MNHFSDLDSRIIRDRVDLITAYDEWRRIKSVSSDVLDGTMGYERRGDKEYLYRRIKKRGSRITKSLGVRSGETDRILAAFHRQQEDAKERLAILSDRINTLAGVMRALNYARMPRLPARILRRLDESSLSPRFRVVGTFALYAFEAAAGVMIEGQHLQTGDMDILVDDRSKLQIVVDGDVAGIEAVVKSVDGSFEQRNPGDFRLTNKESFMVEFIRPEPKPIHRPMPGEGTGVTGDVRPAMIEGLEWLVSAPAFEATVIDERGYPVRMTAPAPAIWAAHKLWVSGRPDRDPAKAIRDRRQVDVVRDLIAARLPNEALDSHKHSALPKDVAAGFEKLIGASETDVSRRIEPDW